MDKKELGGMLKGKLQEATDAVKNAAKDAKIPEVKMPEIKKPDIKVPDQVKNVFKKKDENNESSTEETAEEKKEYSKSEIEMVKGISPLNAVKVFYYLMVADGNIEKSEDEKFTLIGREIDPEFDEHKEYVIKVCKEQLDKVIDSEDYYDVVQDGIEEALLAKQDFDKGLVPVKLLVWDLLMLAYSDEAYSETERKLIKYIVRKVDIPKDVFLEMENSLLTVNDLENELKWIKNTDRPYLTIETQVKEIERREQAVYESIKALIVL